jgi:hypothetical protein
MIAGQLSVAAQIVHEPDQAQQRQGLHSTLLQRMHLSDSMRRAHHHCSGMQVCSAQVTTCKACL